MTVDTACSSSLVALHLACQALRHGRVLAGAGGRCDGAGAPGDVHRVQPPARAGARRALQVLRGGGGRRGLVGGRGRGGCLSGSPTRSGTATAVLALVRGSAVNQDGASNGLTAPERPLAGARDRQALADAGLSPGEVDAVEAHGTGTRARRSDRGAGAARDLRAGAAGGARCGSGRSSRTSATPRPRPGWPGVIKMVLAMRHGVLPRTLHVDEPSPARRLVGGRGAAADRAGAVARGRASAPRGGLLVRHQRHQRARDPRGGPPAEPRCCRTPASPRTLRRSGACCGWCPAAASGRCAPRRERLRTHLEAHQSSSRATWRSRWPPPRATRVARGRRGWRDREELARRALTRSRTARPAGGVVEGPRRRGRGRRSCSPARAPSARAWARALRGRTPCFGEALGEVCASSTASGGLASEAAPLREVVFAAEGSPEAALLDETEFTQPALFALEVALSALVGAWGVQPDLLIGHSIGELVAAHVAGVFSLTTPARSSPRAGA